MSQIVVAMSAGGIAAFLATPTDVATIRMATDGRLPPHERRNYKHAFDAFARIWREEGLDGLWKGGQATVIRAIVANVAQLVSYSQAKQFFLQKVQMNDNFQCHLASSLVSGFVYATVTNPLDMAKTRIQTMKTKDGKQLYNGLLDVWSKTIRSEGFFALWKGFVPYYFRIAPATVLLFIFVERLTILYKSKILGTSGSSGM